MINERKVWVMNRLRHIMWRSIGCCVIIGLEFTTSMLAAPPGGEPRKSTDLKGPAARVANVEAATTNDQGVADSSVKVVDDDAQLKELESLGPPGADIIHVLQYARSGYRRMVETIHDYTCIIYKREPLDNKREEAQYMEARIRHERRDGDKLIAPFSVYLKFRKPERVQGREVLYVQGKHHNDVIARRGGRRNPNMTLELDPKGPLAMDGNRYPITEIGIKNLTSQLIGVLEQELTSDNCEVKSFRDAKLNNRPCIHFQVRHTVRRPDQRYYMARVLVDEELKIPVYFASYDWPKEEGGEPQLLEEYAYLDIKINIGLTDKDFDVANPDYHFKQIESPSSDITSEPDDGSDPQAGVPTPPQDDQAKSENEPQIDADEHR